MLFSCKINRIHKGEKVGKWIEKDSINTDLYTTIGKYRKGKQIKIWKQYENDKILRSEKFTGNTSIITYYHKNGKIATQGKSKEKELHWYYSGLWKYYDINGNLILVRNYEEGNPTYEIEINSY